MIRSYSACLFAAAASASAFALVELRDEREDDTRDEY